MANTVTVFCESSDNEDEEGYHTDTCLTRTALKRNAENAVLFYWQREDHRYLTRAVNKQNQAAYRGGGKEKGEEHTQTPTQDRQVGALQSLGFCLPEGLRYHLKVMALELAWTLLTDKHTPSYHALASSVEVVFPG